MIITSGILSNQLTWSSPIFNGGSNITKYLIYRGANTNNYNFIGTSLITSFNDTGLIGGQNYFYRVLACNEIGEGSFSIEVSSIPVGAPYINKEIKINLLEEKFLEIQWDEPISDGGSPLLGYNIYRSDNDNSFVLIDTVSNNIYSYIDQNIMVNHSYEYYITAYNAIGESKPTSISSYSIILITSVESSISTETVPNTDYTTSTITVTNETTETSTTTQSAIGFSSFIMLVALVLYRRKNFKYR